MTSSQFEGFSTQNNSSEFVAFRVPADSRCIHMLSNDESEKNEKLRMKKGGV